MSENRPAGPTRPPPGPTGPPPSTSAARFRRSALARDWAGPALVAGTILGTSLVLAVIFGLLMRPAVAGVSYNARTTLTFLAWVWASTFGADLTVHATILGADIDGGLGTFPLTLTIAALAAGVVVLRRRMSAYDSPLGALGLVVKAALITAVPLLVVSWVCFSDLSSLTRLAGFAAPAQLGSARIGASSVGSFFLTFVVVTVGLGCAVLAREAWRRPGPLGAVVRWVAAPLRGLAVLLVGLVVAGLVGAVSVWIFGGTSTLHPTAHQWVNIAAAVVAYAGNLGLALVTLGAGGTVGFSTDVPGLQHAEAHRLAWWASDQGINAGLWVALALTPLVLAAAAYAVVRRRGTTPVLLRGLAVFVVSLLAVVPVLVHITSAHAHASLDLTQVGAGIVQLLPLLLGRLGLGGLSSALGGLPQRITGHASAGPGGVGATFLLFGYAVVVSLVVDLLVRRRR